MNIFILDKSIETNVRSHCDKHVVKMVTEYVQIISTVLHNLGHSAAFKPTHVNHPCVKWCNESLDNFQFLYKLADSLGEEYTHRYKKLHQSHLKLKSMCDRSPGNLRSIGLTPFINCTPYKDLSVVEAYRKTYLIDKRHFCKWTNRMSPEWWDVIC